MRGVLVRVASLLAALALVAAPAAGAQEPAPEAPRLDASSWLLIDARDGDRLAAKAPNARRSIASQTKLMTAYLALRERPDRKLVVPQYDALPAESVAGLTAGERLTVRDLRHGDDASQRQRRRRDRRRGPGAEPRGIRGPDEPGGRPARPRRDQLREPDRARRPGQLLDRRRPRRAGAGASRGRPVPRDRRSDRGDARERRGRAHGRLPQHPAAQPTRASTGSRPATRSTAGYVLVASAERRGVPLLSVVLGAASEAARDAETEELLDYGYSLYERRSPFRGRGRARGGGRPLRGRAAAARRQAGAGGTGARGPGPARRVRRAGSRSRARSSAASGSAGRRHARRGAGRVGPADRRRAIAEPTFVDRVGGPAVVVAAAVAADRHTARGCLLGDPQEAPGARG